MSWLGYVSANAGMTPVPAARASVAPIERSSLRETFMAFSFNRLTAENVFADCSYRQVLPLRFNPSSLHVAAPVLHILIDPCLPFFRRRDPRITADAVEELLALGG